MPKTDELYELKRQGRAAYDKLLPELRKEYEDKVVVIDIGPSKEHRYVVADTRQEATTKAEHELGWTTFYVRVIGEDTLHTESVLSISMT